jgi:hypothetical protein
VHLTIELPEQIGAELQREAQRQGMGADRYASQIIQQNLMAIERARSLRDLFEQWEREDETDDPQELARRAAEWEELKRALNANRGTGRRLLGVCQSIGANG